MRMLLPFTILLRAHKRADVCRTLIIVVSESKEAVQASQFAREYCLHTCASSSGVTCEIDKQSQDTNLPAGVLTSVKHRK